MALALSGVEPKNEENRSTARPRARHAVGSRPARLPQQSGACRMLTYCAKFCNQTDKPAGRPPLTLTIFVAPEGAAGDGTRDEMRLLLVEDSSRLRELLTEAVHGAGWRIDAVGGVEDAQAAVAVAPYDLFLIDLGLPDGDGLDLIRALRRAGVKTPVLVLTARGAIDERIAGLDAGADDYLVKPFNTGEFLARCRALLRRAPNASPPTLTAGRVTLDVASGVSACGDSDLGLAPRERMVLEIMMRDVGRVVQKRKLEHALSEFGDEISSNAVELAVSRLRKKLEPHDCGVSLETIRGVGYLLREARL